MDPLEIIAATADPSFATDEGGRVVIWNPAVERLLGYRAQDVLGRSCHEVICGRDIFGNRFCVELCTIMSMVQRGEGIRRFELDVRKSSSEVFRASITIVVIPGPRESQFTIVHIILPLEGDSARSAVPVVGPEPGLSIPIPDEGESLTEPVSPLTARELEVLRLMAKGTSTREIADALFISIATVRNHVQHILSKLDAHSKLEAVALALQNRLI